MSAEEAERGNATVFPAVWATLALALFYVLLGWAWKPRFAFGDAAGIYWLLIAFDWTALPLAGLALLAAVGLAIVWAVGALRRRRSGRRLGVSAGLVLLAAALLLGASFPAIVSPWAPVDAARAGGRTFYLGATRALIDTNYALFECDRLGLFCRQVFRSGDVSSSGNVDGELRFDPETGELAMVVGAGEVVFRYDPRRSREYPPGG